MRRLGFLLVLFMPSIVYAVPGTYLALIDITLSPDNATPGSDLDLSITVQNIGPSLIKNVNLQLRGGAPFMTVSPQESKIIKFMNYHDEETVTYSLEIDSSTIEGDYSLDLAASFEDIDTEIVYEQSIPIVIHVDGTPEIEVSLSSSNPSEVRAGDVVTLTLKVRNKGSSIAKDVVLFINDTDYLDVSFDSSSISVGDINSKESASVPVNLRVSKEATLGVHKLPVRTVYIDDDGFDYQVNQGIIVELAKEAVFEIVEIENPQLFNSDTRRQITIYFKNKGTRAAEDVRFTMLAKYPFVPTGRSFFVELVGVNETVPVTFEVSVDDEAGTQAYPADVQIEWLENDESFSELERFSLSVTRAPSLLPWISIGLVVAVVAVMYYLNKRTQY